MVLEYANEGNLRDYLKGKFPVLEWKDKIQMALNITCGLKFVHFYDIIHGNLVNLYIVVFCYNVIFDNNHINSYLLALKKHTGK